MDIFSANLMTPEVRGAVITKNNKRQGWPERHLLRNGQYYKFYKIYNTLDRILQNRSDFSEYERSTIKEIRDKLEELRKNRFVEYWKIKEIENNKNQNP